MILSGCNWTSLVSWIQLSDLRFGRRPDAVLERLDRSEREGAGPAAGSADVGVGESACCSCFLRRPPHLQLLPAGHGYGQQAPQAPHPSPASPAGPPPAAPAAALTSTWAARFPRPQALHRARPPEPLIPPPPSVRAKFLSGHPMPQPRNAPSLPSGSATRRAIESDRAPKEPWRRHDSP